MVYVGMPTHGDRVQLLKYYLNGNHDMPRKDLHHLATLSDGFTHADVERAVTTAASFFYQEMFNGNIDKNAKEGQKISKSEMEFVFRNSTPTTDSWMTHDIQDFQIRYPNLIWESTNKKQRQKAKVNENFVTTLLKILCLK